MVRSLMFAAVLFGVVLGGLCMADERVLLTVRSPRRLELPTLGIWEDDSRKQDRFYRYLSASFPGVPEFTTDLWCFESHGITYASARALADGRVEMRHTWEAKPWEIVTTATPLADGLELVSRLVAKDDAASPKPAEYPNLNVCWQLRRAALFASEPEPYPEFVRRCFIFTDQGRTFLLDTQRRPIPVKPPTHAHNTPPWVQMYLPKGAPKELRAGSSGWADYSPDRYTEPVIGAVSRDGKYLAALAAGNESVVSQAWHDCMHNNPGWMPAKEGSSKEWRIRLYVMENDPDLLLERFKRDFPDVARWR